MPDQLTGRYSTLVADPPWTHPRRYPQADARRHYPVMGTAEIAALPIEELAAEDAHLWIWGINGLLDHAYQVARAWGFKPINLVTWCKPGPGVGSYLRTNTEHVVLATRGRPLIPDTKAMSTWYQWPRSGHSSKPDAFYDLVEQVSPAPRLELFARRARFGWDYAGNESLSTATVPGVAA